MIQHWVKSLEADLMETAELSDLGRVALTRAVAAIDTAVPYLFRNAALEQIAGEIEEVTELDALARLMWKAATEVRFQHATIFLLRQGGTAPFNARVCTSLPTAWLQRFREENYQMIDPVFTKAWMTDGDFLFSDIPSDTPATDAFWDDAEAHGIGRNGFCTTTSLRHGTRIAVSFTSTDSDARLKDTMRYVGSDLVQLARVAVDAFTYLARTTTPTAAALTKTELRFLHLLVTSDRPERALEVMPQFGSNKALQVSIREKLGVSSILQAVALASANAWFDDMPYDVEDVSSAFKELSGWGLVEGEILGVGGD